MCPVQYRKLQVGNNKNIYSPKVSSLCFKLSIIIHMYGSIHIIKRKFVKFRGKTKLRGALWADNHFGT